MVDRCKLGKCSICSLQMYIHVLAICSSRKHSITEAF